MRKYCRSNAKSLNVFLGGKEARLNSNFQSRFRILRFPREGRKSMVRLEQALGDRSFHVFFVCDSLGSPALLMGTPKPQPVGKWNL
jgi:hypothetical protein